MYDVTCSDESVSVIRGFVNDVESMVPALVHTLALEVRHPFPPHQRLHVTFNDRGACYEANGRITINAAKTLAKADDPVYRGGSLFHETTHAILQGFGHDWGNYITESMAAILQVEALKRIPQQPDGRIAAEQHAGWGYNPDLDGHLWDCYREHGFDPFRRVIEFLGRNTGILKLESFKRDWDWVCSHLGLGMGFPN